LTNQGIDSDIPREKYPTVGSCSYRRQGTLNVRESVNVGDG